MLQGGSLFRGQTNLTFWLFKGTHRIPARGNEARLPTFCLSLAFVFGGLLAPVTFRLSCHEQTDVHLWHGVDHSRFRDGGGPDIEDDTNLICGV